MDHITAQDITAQDDVQKLANRIDELLTQKWTANNIVPATPADDSEFLGRAWLDIAGKIPTAADAQDFLDDTAADKRRQLVNDLLNGPNYVVNWANIWRRILIPEADSDFNTRYMLPSFDAWLRQRLDENTPYDDFVREILTTPVSGVNPYQNSNGLSPFAYYQSKEIKPENLAAATSRMFLGIRIECAQCHDHPFDSWKRKDFWGYATFFAAMQRQQTGTGILGQLQELFNRQTLTVPDTEEVVKATYLTGESPNIATGSSARMTLADWVTSKENPYFARTAANRLWGHFFGIGIVDPIDDFSDANPPSHPELLDLLASELIAHDFDLKFLLRAITASRAYQLTSSIRSPGDTSEPELFSRMAVKGLTAEQFYDSVSQAVGSLETFDTMQQMRFGGTARSKFIEQFSDSRSGPTERQTSVLQALAMMNGQLITSATDLESSRTLAGIIAYPGFDSARRIETLFLSALHRKPRPDELQHFLNYVESSGAEKTTSSALADVFWVLL
ncbi:MAG: DUF1549 and DUF1553 domain-containing protein, partial [Planctomycetota bacterium]|nr:DUF1549 and DUF1553 domain-containing protein [Planctomycetota bacterium]